MKLTKVRIVGSGLIGTSIGLGLAAKGVSIEMVDIDPRSQALAQDLVGPSKEGNSELVILAAPISALSSLLDTEFALNASSSFIDISSVKTNPKLYVSSSNLPLNRFLPSHPMAGREVGGAESARADLFQGRPWIVDSRGVDSDVLAQGRELISLLGGHEIEMAAEEHDQAVALVSHLPQLISSLMAKQLQDGEEKWLELAGAGLRDTVRIAGSDPLLWKEIIAANSESLKTLLEKVKGDLDQLIESLDDPASVEKFIAAGNAGRNRIPGKHGGVARKYTYLPVVIEDKPGQLSALFDECAHAKVNVEDLSIEHSPEQLTGLITLALSQGDADVLEEHLRKKGWSVHAPRGART